MEHASTYGSWLLGSDELGIRRLRWRLQVLLTTVVVSANAIGALIVAALVFVIIPGEQVNRPFMIALAISGPTYTLLALLFGAIYGTHISIRTLRWAINENVPTAKERRDALRLPWRLSRLQAVLWTLGTVPITILAIILQPAAILSLIFAIVIAAMVVSTISYLLAEFILRPVAARALIHEPSIRTRRLGLRRRLLLFWGLGTGAPVMGLMIGGLVVLVVPEASSRQFAIVVLGLCAVILAFGLLVTDLTARWVIGPVDAVAEAMDKVAEGQLDVEVPVYDVTALGKLQYGFNNMARGLREREKLRDLFGRHVGRDVAALAADGEIHLGGDAREVSVLMIDIVGSTTYATEHTATEVVTMLNRFFEVVVEEVQAHGGLVNKFMGDAVLAIFGAPVQLADHATCALAAARAMADRLEREVSEIGAGIGVATGEVVAGNIGDESRFEYTVIGDAVNSAARLTELSKQVPGKVLVMQASVDAASPTEAGMWTSIPGQVLRGRSEPTALAIRCMAAEA